MERVTGDRMTARSSIFFVFLNFLLYILEAKPKKRKKDKRKATSPANFPEFRVGFFLFTSLPDGRPPGVSHTTDNY